ncbi:ParB N-terminal domain-containing protein [Marinobacter fonticola]|uniref:hypothetical protein n=1 Tax=Marinobacter fonticola TaxID=2603215 RepID=UPI0011E6BC24|nr:hypothetical protein [Marinobacter fonticola]
MKGIPLRSLFKKSLKSTFSIVGLEIESKENKKGVLPPVYETLDEAIYAKNIGLSVAYNCPLEKCVTPTGFSFSEDRFHPFVTALEEINNHPQTPSYLGSFLERYYQAWTPENGRGVYPGFNHAPDGLRAVSAITIHSPWMDATPEHRQILMERTIAYENATANHPELPFSAGYGLHGPVTPEKGQLEFERLLKVNRAIKEKGYDRTISKEDITAIAIERTGEYRFCIMHGQHRMAALAALKYRQVPVNITKLLHYNEIEHWPQVYRGVWSTSQARAYIDHLFDFESEKWAKQQRLIK